MEIDELFVAGVEEVVFSAELPAEDSGSEGEREGCGEENEELEGIREAGELECECEISGLEVSECCEEERERGDSDVVKGAEAAKEVCADGDRMKAVNEHDPGCGMPGDAEEEDQPSLHELAPKRLLILMSRGTNFAKAFARWLMRCLTVGVSCPKVR